MNGRQKIILDRVLFCLLGLVLVLSFAVLYWILARDASFCAGVGAASIIEADAPDSQICMIEEPADAYELATITFGGTCTPASMLGSDAYGTFNQAYKDSGAAYFFARVKEVLAKDSLTLVGCNAVFTDRSELKTADKELLEWYRAPTETASVFSCGGIDAVSLACVRSSDYGADGYADTKAALEAQSVLWGDSGKAIYQSLPGGIQAAIYCCKYTEDTAPGIISWIEKVRAENDFVAVYVTDTEDSYTVSAKKREAYRSFVEAGADVVVGTNGAKLQPIEKWEDGFIAYSLGALMDGATKYPEKTAALLRVNIKSDFGEITEITCEPLPCSTFDEEHTWSPMLLKKGEERDSVLAFLYGERTEP